jgi:uncharacterized protein (DUF1499 family)
MMRRKTPFDRLAAGVLVLAVLGLLLELLAGPAYRLQWLALKPALLTMRWAATLSAAVCVLALVLAGLAALRFAPRARRQAAVAVLLSLLAFGPPAYLWLQVNRLPHIHDVSTDTQAPPTFVAIAPLRKDVPNGLDYKPDLAALQKQGYPDIAPLVLPLPPLQVFGRAEQLVKTMGWELVAAQPMELRLEATATTLLFGFKDDVVIRIRPEGPGSRVDVRSVSRVGGSDFGTNAKRIRAFLTQLQRP